MKRVLALTYLVVLKIQEILLRRLSQKSIMNIWRENQYMRDKTNMIFCTRRWLRKHQERVLSLLQKPHHLKKTKFKWSIESILIIWIKLVMFNQFNLQSIEIPHGSIQTNKKLMILFLMKREVIVLPIVIHNILNNSKKIKLLIPV